MHACIIIYMYVYIHVDMWTCGHVYIYIYIGQSRDGHNVPGFHGHSDIGVHTHVGYLRTIPGWT